MHHLRPNPFLVFLIALACAGVALGQAGSGTKYRVTSTMDVSGMSIPARSTEMCTSKDGDASMIPTDKNCKVVDYRAAGNKTTFRMVCTGKDGMTGRGEFERLAGGYRGRVVMNDPEANVNMTMNFEGKRIGDCDYGKESPQAQGQAMLKQSCDSLVRESSFGAYNMFTGPTAQCASYRARYCPAMLAASTTPAFIGKNGKSPALWEATQACGQPRTTVLVQACRKASVGKDGDFIAEYCPELLVQACASADVKLNAGFIVDRCPARARALSAEHCAGRSYTALYNSPYANFCSEFAASELDKRNGGKGRGSRGTSATDETPAQDAPKKSSWKDKFKSMKDAVIGG